MITDINPNLYLQIREAILVNDIQSQDDTKTDNEAQYWPVALPENEYKNPYNKFITLLRNVYSITIILSAYFLYTFLINNFNNFIFIVQNEYNQYVELKKELTNAEKIEQKNKKATIKFKQYTAEYDKNYFANLPILRDTTLPYLNKQPGNRLVTLPCDDSLEKQNTSILNIYNLIGTTNIITWKKYGKTVKTRYNKPVISIIITNMGQSIENTVMAIKSLPHNISLSFNPNAENSQRLMKEARNCGNESLIDIRMESFSPNFGPGKKGLYTSLSTKQNINNIKALTQKFFGFIGIVGLFGDKFMTTSYQARAVMKYLKENKLIYINTLHQNIFEGTDMLEYAYVNSTILIDQKGFAASIDRRLNYLLTVAKKYGYAVGIIERGSPTVYQTISQWYNKNKNNIDLLPISSIVRLRERLQKGQID